MAQNNDNQCLCKSKHSTEYPIKPGRDGYLDNFRNDLSQQGCNHIGNNEKNNIGPDKDYFTIIGKVR